MDKERIDELEARLSRLEKIENKRKTLRIVHILIKLIIYIAIAVALLMEYNYINNKYIKPYKETVDEIKEKYDSIKDTSLDLNKILGIEKEKKK